MRAEVGARFGRVMVAATQGPGDLTPTGENPGQPSEEERRMTNNPSSVSTTISIRVSHRNLARIDDAAKRAGQDRNRYILKWIPEYDDDRCDTAHVDGRNGHRGASSEPVDWAGVTQHTRA